MGETGAATYGSSAGSGVDKGKGKAVDNHLADDISMGEDEESSSDESTADLVCFFQRKKKELGMVVGGGRRFS